MRYETQTIRIGENVGPVDWDHPLAKDMPPIWREAEASPGDFLFGEYRREIICICMYDGWPYWTPTPGIFFVGPIGPEWNHFNSYGVRPSSIYRKVPAQGTEARQGGDACGSVHDGPVPQECAPILPNSPATQPGDK